MNEILKKLIEKAAREFNQKESIPYALVGHTFNAFIEGAAFILQNQWISVEEELPEKEQCVLVAALDTINNEYNYGFDTITDSTEVVTDEHGFRIWADTDRITHWMPIPELPKGGEK